jgi:hypothetical protein
MVGGVADTYFPFFGGSNNVTTDGWSQMIGPLGPDGVIAESPAVTLSSGLNFVIPDTFEARCKGFHYRSAGSTTKAGEENTNSLPRRDRLVLRLDRTAKSLVPVVKKGTPSSGTPPLPGLTQTPTGIYEIPLYHATCPGNGSAQNYSNLTAEYSAVSGARGRHAWQGTYLVGAADQRLTGIAALDGYGGTIATLASDQITLNRPGHWSLSLVGYSNNPSAGVSGIWMYWPGGPSAYAQLRDDRPRTPVSGMPASADLWQTRSWSGIVTPAQAALPIQLWAAWMSLGTSATYQLTMYADYLGG